MGAKGVRIALWCEETDYPSFKCMNGGDALPTRYEQWATVAREELHDLLSCGHAAQIVRVKLREYFAWLGQRGAPDTPLERKRYMLYLAAEAGGDPDVTGRHKLGFPSLNRSCSRSWREALRPGQIRTGRVISAPRGGERQTEVMPEAACLDRGVVGGILSACGSHANDRFPPGAAIR